MKVFFAIASWMLLTSGYASNQHITIIGPRTITTESALKAFVSADNLKSNDTLVLILKSQNEVLDVKKFEGEVKISREVEFELPEQPFDFYNLVALLISERGKDKNICMVREVKIATDDTKSFFNLIQMDKPIYRPNERLRFRILTLDHETKPYKYSSIKVNIVDPKGVIKKSFNDNQPSEFGFYRNSFLISEQAIDGTWKIEVQIDERTTKTSKPFMVRDFKTPPFKLFIETNPVVSLDSSNPSINLKIYAKYPFDKFVEGSAKLYAQIYNKNSPSNLMSEITRDIKINGIENVKFDLKKDLAIHYLAKSVIVNFKVDFIEDNIGRETEAYQSVEVIPKGKNIIKLSKPDTFKNGLSYKVFAEVFNLNGVLTRDSSIPIVMKYKYFYHNGRTSGDNTYPQFLREGKANFTITPPAETKNISLSFEYDATVVMETIYKNKKGEDDEVIQVSFDPVNPQIGEKIKISVESNSLMSSLKVIVLNRNGLIHSDSYGRADGSSSYDFELNVTREMAPEATIIVFYTREQDGEIIYDQFIITPESVSNNFFSIRPNSQIYKPGETAAFTLNTSPQSFVGIIGVDQSIQYLSTNNDITKNDVNAKIASIGKIKSAEYKGKFYLDLAKSNAFVIQPLKTTKHVCKPSEEKYLETGIVGRLEVIEAENEIDYDADIFDEFEDLDIFNPQVEKVRKYFPDVWIFDDFEMQRQITSFSQILPDTITTWSVGGFSIHPEHGLAIADPQQIKVTQDFFVKVGVPSSVKIGEIFKVDVTVHNYLNAKQNVKIVLQQGDFEFLIERHIAGKPAGCNEYTLTNAYQMQVDVDQESSDNTEFTIKAIKSGKLTLRVEASSAGAQDIVEKTVTVAYEGATLYKSFPMMIDLRNNSTFTKNILVDIPDNAEPNTINIEASVSGNLLGPAMENIERLITMPEGCGEQKMKSFALSIYAYKYLKSLNMANSTLSETAFNSIRQGYRNVQSMQGLSGAFKLWSKDDSSEGIWLTSYVTDLLNDAAEFIDVDSRISATAIQYLTNKQNQDGSFDDDDKNPRRIIGSLQHRKVQLTAAAMIAIAKSNKSMDEFAYVYDDAKEFLSKTQVPFDFEKAIVAYALSFADDVKRAANEMINKLDWNFLRLKPDQVKAVQIETASYIVLAALKLERFNDAKRAADWLIEQRRPHGGFLSTHDTVVGLQALVAMEEYLDTQTPYMNVKLTPGGFVRMEGEIYTKFIELSPTVRNLTVSATGSGLAYINVFYQYKTKKALSNTFTFKLLNIEELEESLTINFNVASRVNTNMAIVDVELPSGYEYSSGKFSSDVKLVETNEDKSRVYIYFKSITPQTINQIQSIEAIKVFDVEQLKASLVTVYDYYEPDLLRTNFFYDLKHEQICSAPISSIDLTNHV